MEGEVIAVSGAKGGVGKTTVAVNLAAALDAEGVDVALVDADLRMANLSAVLGIDGETRLHAVLQGEAPVDEAVVETPAGAVLPGETSLDAVGETDPAELAPVVEQLAASRDVVVLDTGGGISHEVALTLGVADVVVLVTTPDDTAVHDAGKTAALTDRVEGSVLGAVLNRARTADDVARARAGLSAPLLAVVPEDRAATGGEPLVRTAPDTAPAEALRGLAETLRAVRETDASAASVETVYDEAWVVSEDDGADDDDGDEVFGLFN